jgi:hypothetical protein
MLVGNVYVGTPQTGAQPATPVLFDTNFDATVIEGPDCKTCKSATYDPKTSTTYSLVSSAIYSYAFDSTTWINGVKVKDRVCLSLNADCANNFIFVAATSETKNLSPNISGVLGLTLGKINSYQADGKPKYTVESRFIDYLFDSG